MQQVIYWYMHEEDELMEKDLDLDDEMDEEEDIADDFAVEEEEEI